MNRNLALTALLSILLFTSTAMGQGGTGRAQPTPSPSKATPKKTTSARTPPLKKGTSSKTQPPGKNTASAKPDAPAQLHVSGLLRTVTLPVPPAAKGEDVSGGVRIRITLDETGQVTATQPVHGHPALLDAAVSDARGQHFSPATLNGRPVKSIGLIDYVFTKPTTSAPNASPPATRLEGTITLDIDPTTGLIALESCPVIRTRTFVLGTEPKKFCDPKYHRTTFTNSHGIEFKLIPGATFMMGSRDSEPQRMDEKPQHQVAVMTFFIGKHEVTQAQWQSVMGNNPSKFKDCGGNCPVEQVSWDDTQSFINKLNQSNDGWTYRLPTEAEWEYACRAGSTEDYAGSLSEMAWYEGNSPGKTHVVGQKQPNAWGLADMHGNVWEWCQDWYHETYYGAPNDGSAWLSGGEQKYRVLRGGSWNSDATSLRSASRGPGVLGRRSGDRGLRVVAVARTQ